MLVEAENKVFQLDNLIMAPFPAEDWLAMTYLRMKQEGTLDLIFYEGIPNLQRFLGFFTRQGVTTFGAFRKSLHTDGVDLLGIGRIDEPVSMGNGYKKSEITVGFFREFWARKYTMPHAQMMVEWCFRYTEIDVLFGTTPEPNKAMVRFARSLGYRLDYLPNYTTWKGDICGVWVSSMTQEQWKSASPFNKSDSEQ